jgi:hypothetical protein
MVAEQFYIQYRTSSARLILVTWIGINDLSFVPDLKTDITVLFETAEHLYSCEARQFIFFNVPPLERTPQGTY